MNSSLLNLNQAAIKTEPAPAPAAETERPRQSKEQDREQDGGDFEIVFGRRQIAGTGLVLVVGLVCFSGISYLIGRSAGSKNASAAATAPAADTARPVASSRPAIPVVTPASATVTTAPAASFKDSSPVFSDAITGQVYIQVGAIDRGLAGIWAEGLRTHGLKAIVSTGPSSNIWRVLVGPLPDPQAYQQVKNVLDQLGIQTFGRRYVDTPARPQSAQPVSPEPSVATPAPAN